MMCSVSEQRQERREEKRREETKTKEESKSGESRRKERVAQFSQVCLGR